MRKPGYVRLGNKRVGAPGKPGARETTVDIDRRNPVLGYLFRAGSQPGRERPQWTMRDQARRLSHGGADRRWRGSALRAIQPRLDIFHDAREAQGPIRSSRSRALQRMASPCSNSLFGGKLALSRVSGSGRNWSRKSPISVGAEDGRLRHTVFMASREDKPASEVRAREPRVNMLNCCYASRAKLPEE